MDQENEFLKVVIYTKYCNKPCVYTCEYDVNTFSDKRNYLLSIIDEFMNGNGENKLFFDNGDVFICPPENVSCISVVKCNKNGETI